MYNKEKTHTKWGRIMGNLDRAVKRLGLVREGLQEGTIELNDALDIILEHLIELCQVLQKETE